MAKRQDFAEKVKKATIEKGVRCPVCNSQKVPTLFVNSIKTNLGSYKFKRTNIQVCKCNEKSIYN
ncbi:MAG: hypothetical protein O3A55_04795 [Bacteroidetes bacterium]|nr:hypothetical protein [Bacteroidota bacterium]